MNRPTPSVNAPMIDTHCHLDDHQFAHDLPAVLQRSRAANVTRWILIGYDPRQWDTVIQMAEEHEGMSHTLGVHPSCAHLWNENTERSLRESLLSSGARGIGEAGLDFYRDNAPLAVQAIAFAGQLQVALDMQLPVVIHMRSAEDEILEILQDGRSLPTLVFHSFDGSEHLIDFILQTGSYVGIGGLATRQKSIDLRRLLDGLPVERFLLETDSPYLVPARQKERRNEPAHVSTICEMMAIYFGLDSDILAAQTTENAERVFGLTHG